MADTELEEKSGGGGEWGQLFDQSKSPQSETWPCKPYAGNMMGGEGRGFPWVPSLGLPLQVQETPIYGILVNDQQV